MKLRKWEDWKNFKHLSFWRNLLNRTSFWNAFRFLPKKILD